MVAPCWAIQNYTQSRHIPGMQWHDDVKAELKIEAYTLVVVSKIQLLFEDVGGIWNSATQLMITHRPLDREICF